jgi:hypothetical protein
MRVGFRQRRPPGGDRLQSDRVGQARGTRRAAYSCYVLSRIAEHPIDSIKQLLPSNVAASLPSIIRAAALSYVVENEVTFDCCANSFGVLFVGATGLHLDFVRATFDDVVTDRQICAVGHRSEIRPDSSIYSCVLDLDWFYAPRYKFCVLWNCSVGCSAIMPARAVGATTIVAMD